MVRATVVLLVVALALAIVLSAWAVSRSESNQSFDPAATFQARCSGCHGATGEGGTGPKLSGGAVLRKYPNIEDQIAVVTNGRGQMPSFKGKGLSAAQIRAVVEYTRAL
jgi:mono/diheme cytochrome c family protein